MVMGETLPVSWICPVCDYSSPSDEEYCQNCGLPKGTTGRQAEEHRIAYAQAPDEVRERARASNYRRRLVEILILLLVAVAGLSVLALSVVYLR